MTIDVLGGEGPDDLHFAVEPGGLLRGRVLADDGGEAGGAAVSVYDARGRRVGRTYAGPDGNYEIPRLPPGPLEVFARHKDEVAREATSLFEGHERELTIALHRMGEVRGRVLDAAGKVLKRVLIEARSHDGIVFRRVRTDSKGRYRIRHLYPGSYRVRLADKQRKAETTVPVAPRAVVDGVDLAAASR